MSSKRRVYTPEFKQKAVRLAETSHQTIVQIEKNLAFLTACSINGSGNSNRKATRRSGARANRRPKPKNYTGYAGKINYYARSAKS